MPGRCGDLEIFELGITEALDKLLVWISSSFRHSHHVHEDD
jgi:hypothetical protein